MPSTSLPLRAWCERAFFALERVVTAVLYPYCALRQRFARQGRVAILMYHQIGRPFEGPGGDECVSPERFERQLRAILDAGYRVVSLSRFVDDPRLAIQPDRDVTHRRAACNLVTRASWSRRAASAGSGAS